MKNYKIILIIALLGFATGNISCKDSNQKLTSKPNILFIAIDDMNDWVGFLGGHPQAKTPNMDKLAKQGVAFTNAHTPAPACSPCRNALLYGQQPHTSGLYPFYHRDKITPEFFEKRKSLMEIFRANGYNTFGAGKVHHKTINEESIKRFDHLEYSESINDKLRNLPTLVVDSTDGVGSKTMGKMCFRPSLSPLEHHRDYVSSMFGLDVLKRKHEKPFFLAVGLAKPHLPFVAPKKYFDMFPIEDIKMTPIKDDDLADIPWVGRSNAKLNDDFRNRKEGTWHDVIRAYLACIAYTDENVGRLMEALNNSEYKDNTIVVLWSDHGYHFGEKRSHRKFSLWEEATRVPFIILDPANKANGKTCSAPVSLIDIYPTLLNYAGIEKPEYSDGLDLKDLIHNPEMERETPALITWGRGNYSLRDSRWRYTRYFDGSEELYDHENDPNEWSNLAGNSDYSEIKKKMQKYLPKNEAPLKTKGKYLHNIVDADTPSLEKFKAFWNEMQENGMNLE